MQFLFNNFLHTYLTGDKTSSFATAVYTEIAEKFTEHVFLLTESQAQKESNDHYNSLKAREGSGDLADRTHLCDGKRRLILSKVKVRLNDDIVMEEFYPAPTKKAKEIFAIIDANPVNHKVSYDEESAQLNRLFDEVEKAGVMEGSSVNWHIS